MKTQKRMFRKGQRWPSAERENKKMRETEEQRNRDRDLEGSEQVLPGYSGLTVDTDEATEATGCATAKLGLGSSVWRLM